VQTIGDDGEIGLATVERVAEALVTFRGHVAGLYNARPPG
jgi:hypothetical protein